METKIHVKIFIGKVSSAFSFSLSLSNLYFFFPLFSIFCSFSLNFFSLSLFYSLYLAPLTISKEYIFILYSYKTIILWRLQNLETKIHIKIFIGNVSSAFFSLSFLSLFLLSPFFYFSFLNIIDLLSSFFISRSYSLSLFRVKKYINNNL